MTKAQMENERIELIAALKTTVLELSQIEGDATKGRVANVECTKRVKLEGIRVLKMAEGKPVPKSEARIRCPWCKRVDSNMAPIGLRSGESVME